MSALKIQLHCHTKSDPIDLLLHTDKELIDRAAKEGFEVLAITCHNKRVFSESLRKYAEDKGILLIPGIEKDIEKKHILIINAAEDIKNVYNFEDLRKYRLTHPESLIIVAHPYTPQPYSIGHKKLIKHQNLFDMIEWNGFYTKSLNWNKKSMDAAMKLDKPVIGNADCHHLNYLSYTYSYLKANKDINSIIQTLKNNPEIDISTKPFKNMNFAYNLIHTQIGEWYRLLTGTRYKER